MFVQHWFIYQGDTIFFPTYTNGRGYQVKNVDDPTDSLDAVNLRTLNRLSLFDSINYNVDNDGYVKLLFNGTVVDSVLIDDENFYINNDGLTTHLGDLREHIAHSASPYLSIGGDITDNLDGTITISEGEAFLKTSNDLDADFKAVYIPDTTLTIAANQNIILYVDYNSGSPRYTQRVSTAGYFYQNWDETPFATVINIGSKIISNPFQLSTTNFPFKAVLGQLNYQPLRYLGGLATAETGTRLLNVSAGVILRGYDYEGISGLNTSSGGTFTRMYVTAGTWTRTTGQTTVSNSQYNDIATGLATLTASPERWANKWLYYVVDNPSFWILIEGQTAYTSLAAAQAGGIPSVLPPEVNPFYAGALLVAKITVSGNQTNIVSIQNPFTTVFQTSAAASHSNLSNLYGLAPYYHLSSGQLLYLTDTIPDSLSVHRIEINDLIDTTTIHKTKINQNITDIDALEALSHAAVTLAGTPDYITLSGQQITRNQIDLTTDVTGTLPDANVANNITLDNITQITTRSHTSLSNIGINTHAQIDTHLGSTSNPHSVTAAQTNITDPGDYYSSTNTNAALQEIGPKLVRTGNHVTNDLDTIIGNEYQQIDTFEIENNVIKLSLANDYVPYDSIRINVSDGLYSGGYVSWESGLTFNASFTEFYFDNQYYSSAYTQKTLSAADATNPRIDVIAVDTTGNGTVVVIEGTPAASPQKPTVNPRYQIELTEVLILANATEPGNPGTGDTITVETVYNENVEWTTSSSGVTVDFDGTTSPYNGSVVADVGSLIDLDQIIFTDSGLNERNDWNTISFALKLKQIFTNKMNLYAVFFNGTSAVTTNYKVSIDKSSLDWQIITIPLNDFKWVGTQFDKFSIEFSSNNTNSGIYLDYIRLQGGVIQPTISHVLSTDGTAGNISISGGNTIILNVNDGDYDPTNELQDLSGIRDTIQANYDSIQAILSNVDTLFTTIAISDETTALTTGLAKRTFRMPIGCTITKVRANVVTAPTDATLIFDINESGTSILSTELSIDSGEKTSKTATSAAVISDGSIEDDAEMTIDIDQVGSTVAGAGAKITLYYVKN